MSLAVEVGRLVYLLENDPDGAEWLRESLDAANELLMQRGLPPHEEPTRLPSLRNRSAIRSYPYLFLHALRRVVARTAETPGWKATPAPESWKPSQDALLNQYAEDPRRHLLCHSDCEGFYLPVDFDEVIFDDSERVPGGMIGSAFGLFRELVAIAPVLGIRLSGDRLSDDEAERINRDAETSTWRSELIAWLSLFEAARLSIEHKTAISFS